MTEYYQYDCDECGETVIVTSNPIENSPSSVSTALVCPTHSSIEIDYAVEPDSVDSENITVID